MTENASVGAKRPLGPNGSEMPRKRFADADDDLIEQQFDLEPPEDDFEELLAGSLDEVEDNLGEAGKNWQRPPPPPLDPSTHRLVFQQLDVDYTSGPPNQQLYPSDLVEVPIVRMFGVNEHGTSALSSLPPPFSSHACTHTHTHTYLCRKFCVCLCARIRTLFLHRNSLPYL